MKGERKVSLEEIKERIENLENKGFTEITHEEMEIFLWSGYKGISHRLIAFVVFVFFLLVLSMVL